MAARHRHFHHPSGVRFATITIALLAYVVTGCTSNGGNSQPPPDFTLHAASAMVRLSGPTAVPLPPETDHYELELPRNGHAALQVVVSADSLAATSQPANEPDWQVTVAARTDPWTFFSIYQVLDVHNVKPNDKIPASEERLGWVSDVCFPLSKDGDHWVHDLSATATAQRHRPHAITFLIDAIETDRGMVARPYPPQIHLQVTDGKGSRNLTVILNERPIDLPTKLPFKTGVHWDWNIDKYLGKPLSEQERMSYLDFFLEHRLTPCVFYSKGINFSDNEIHRISAGGGNLFQVFFQGGDGARLITDAQRQQLEPQIKQWREMMNRAGAGNDCYALIADEPLPTAFDTIRSNATWLKSVWPEVKIWVGTRPQAPLMDIADVWDSVVDNSTPHYAPHVFTHESDDLARQSPRHPQRWFFYSNEPFPPKPNARLDNNLVDCRAVGAIGAAWDMDGFEYFWATDWQANKDLLNTPWPAKADKWNPGDAGAGILCYPGNDGLPIPSLRLIALRDAMEDWALLKMAGIMPTLSMDQLRDPATLAKLRQEALEQIMQQRHGK